MPVGGESFDTYSVFWMVWAVVTLPVWVSLGIEYQKAQLGGADREFLLHSWKRRGEGSSRASFADEGGITSCMGYTRSSTSSCLYQGTDICRVDQVIRILLFILGHQQFIVYTRSSAIPCLYPVINDSLFIPGEKWAIHTSDSGVGSASSAGTLQKSDSWAVCVCGAWASAIHASGMILGSEYPPAVQSPGFPRPWEAIQHG